MIDVNNQEHLDAVREACADSKEVHDVTAPIAHKLAERGVKLIPWFEAHRALSRSDLSASLVRDLLARAGLLDHKRVSHDEQAARVIENPDQTSHVKLEIQYRLGIGQDWFVRVYDTTSLISALCDIAPGDRDGAMRALMEVGR